jgi:large subunit ribosomal protein L29
MKASEAKGKPATAQRAELLKLRKEQFALRLQRATGQAVKPDQFGKVRKSIARLKTAMRAQELGLPSGAAKKVSGAKR